MSSSPPAAKQPPAAPTETQLHPRYIAERRPSGVATFFDLLFKFAATGCLLGILIVFALIYKEIKFIAGNDFFWVTEIRSSFVDPVFVENRVTQ